MDLLTDNSVAIVALVLIGLTLAAWLSIADWEEGAKRLARKTLLIGLGFALFALFGAVLLGVPLGAAALIAAGAFVGAGAYQIAASGLGLPEIPFGGIGGNRGGADGELPDPCEVGPYTDSSGVLHLCSQG